MSDKNLAEEVDRELSATLDAVQRRRLEGEGAALKLEDLLAMGLGT